MQDVSVGKNIDFSFPLEEQEQISLALQLIDCLGSLAQYHYCKSMPVVRDKFIKHKILRENIAHDNGSPLTTER